jgi:hypothetical protein
LRKHVLEANTQKQVEIHKKRRESAKSERVFQKCAKEEIENPTFT